MIIIFEGPDAGGKDFIRAAFEEETKYEHTVVSRFFFSQRVYAQYFKRPQWEVNKLRLAMDQDITKFLLHFKPLIVYCHADRAVLDERIRRRGENVEAQPNSGAVAKLYDLSFQNFNVVKNLLSIDTSLEPPMAEIVSRIIGKVKSLEKR